VCFEEISLNMASVQFKANFSNVLDNIKKLKKSLKTRRNTLLEGVGYILESNVKNTIILMLLVDTGRFLNSITHVVEDKRVIVKDGVFYGKFLEFGTIYIRPRAPFQTAIDDSRAEVETFALYWYNGLI